MRKVMARLVPFLMLCYFIAYVDRVNAGFAALTMNRDLGLTQAMFGIGGGLFFVAYVLFEVPSNLAMEKVGARLWIARIMITWGLVGIGMAFVVGPYSFYVGRFLLGAAEAGFFPGVILYLGRAPLSHVLVPRAIPRAGRRDVHGRHPDLKLSGVAALGHASRVGGHPWAARVAVALHPRGTSGGCPRIGRALHAPEPPFGGKVAER